jgi:hypothetical protein
VQIVYSRVSTATQSLLRQRHILTEAGLLVCTEGVAEGFRPADGVLLSVTGTRTAGGLPRGHLDRGPGAGSWVSRAAVRTALADLLPGQGVLPRPSA